jgi:hypothetical protein
MALRLGPDWQREVWLSHYRLRFELAAGERYINMFTSGYDRARTLARAALRGEHLFGVIAGYPDPSAEIGADWKGWIGGAAFELLGAMGVSTDPFEASWRGYVHPGEEADEEAVQWEHRAVRLDWDQANILLWNNIAHDIGVTPQAPVLSQLVDIDRGVVVNAYDDRGMDITALSAKPIAHLYGQFDPWLLGYDRARMADIFDPPDAGS